MRRIVTGLLCMAACHGEAATERPALALPQGAVRFETARGPWVVRVEIAADDASRTRGLMYRRSLDPDRGMIFVHQHSETPMGKQILEMAKQIEGLLIARTRPSFFATSATVTSGSGSTKRPWNS